MSEFNPGYGSAGRVNILKKVKVDGAWCLYSAVVESHGMLKDKVQVYAGPITIPASETLQAIAVVPVFEHRCCLSNIHHRPRRIRLPPRLHSDTAELDQVRRNHLH